jgi:dTDP-glucose 4,6-dehydratase
LVNLPGAKGGSLLRVVGDWSGRRVAVTGAGGFVGSHLAEALVQEGAAVRALVRYNARDDRGALEWIPRSVLEEIDVRAGDVRSQESVAAAVEGCEVVFHLAAQIAIPHSYLDPRTFFETNVLGTLNVAQACLRENAERLVHTSTSEVYGTAQMTPIREDHPIAAQSPYAASKVGADQLVASFERAFGLRASTVRPFNVYGPRQSARSVIPTIISQALAGDVLKLGSLEPRRDFTYVSDAVAGFLAVGASESTVGETVQLGTGTDLSVEEIVGELSSLLDRELLVEQEERRLRPRASEVMRLIAGIENVRRLTSWSPQVPFSEGLRETIQWVEAHPDRYPVEEYVT